MSTRRSIRFAAPHADWPQGLATRLHRVPPPFDPDGELARFRAHSDFYRHRLDGIRRWDEVPPLEREELVHVPEVSSSTRISHATSSGTSGERVRIANDSAEWRMRLLLLYRPYGTYPELPALTRQAIFVDIPPEAENSRPDEVRILGRRYRRWTVSGRAPVWAQWQRLAWIGPHLLTGFSSAMLRLVDAHGQALRRLGVRVLSPAGEHLTAAWRHDLEAAFGAPLRDRYGATESGAIAWQCPHCDGYHTNTDELIVEPQGETGTLVTPLYLTTQPILRYRLEDQVEWVDGPSCEIALPRLRIVAARRDDLLVDGEGHLVAPLAFQFEKFDFLDRWSLDQGPEGGLELYLRTRREPTSDEIAAVLRETRAVVPGRPVEVVRGSPPWRGKFKRVRCRYRSATTG